MTKQASGQSAHHAVSIIYIVNLWRRLKDACVKRK